MLFKKRYANYERKRWRLVYIQDARWWYGGLKSAHATFGEPHDEDGTVYISSLQLDHGQFVEGLQLKAEKEM